MTTAETDLRGRSDGPLWTYQAYGLTLGCDFELPEIPHASGGPLDVRITSGAIPRSIPTLEEGVVFNFEGEQKYLGWPQLGHFLLLPDNTILYEAALGCRRLLRFPLLGPVLSAVLHRAGRLLLHSSAAGMNGRAVFFLGDKGAGKSTTAAALVGTGFDLVTDDVLVLAPEDRTAPIATPGFPQLKLAPYASPLLRDIRRAELPGTDKHRVRLLEAFSPAPHQVAAGYVLRRGSEPGLRRLDPVAALQAVMRYSYITRFGRRLLDAEGLAQHHRQSTRVANATPIYELTVPADLDRLPGIVREVAARAIS